MEVYGIADASNTLLVIDTGATDSVGSPDSITALCQRACAQHPNTTIRVDTLSAKATRFRLANGTITSAYSLVSLDTPLGSFNVYCMEACDVPVLMSIKSLRNLCASIYVSTNEMTYTITRNGHAVQQTRQLKTTPKGHLLFDILDDN